MFGLNGTGKGGTVGGRLPFTPKKLFANSETGFWYDPSAASNATTWRRNLHEHTESFDTDYWIHGGSSSLTTNATLAPDGTATGSFLDRGANWSGSESIIRSFTLPYGQYTFSCYFKLADEASFKGRFYVNASEYASGVVDVTVDMTTGEQISASYPPDARGVEDVGGGWYRAWLTLTGTPTQMRIHPGADTGFANQQCYIWGAQLEEGSTATAYQPIKTTIQQAVVDALVGAPVERRNLLEKTEQLDDAYWTLSGCTVTANATVDPVGGNGAELFSHNSDYGRVERNLSELSDKTVTVSIYAKAGTCTTFGYRTDGSEGTVTQWFDLTNGTLANTTGTPINPFIIDVGNGWYRCGFTVYTFSGLIIRPGYVGNGNSIYLWGAQLEEGGAASTYQSDTEYLAQRAAYSPNAGAIKLWQTNAGISPVYEVEQEVGLMLDQSQGTTLGAELWVDPPENIASSWTDNGDGSYTKNDNVWGNLGDNYSTTTNTTAGNVYLVTFTTDGPMGLYTQNTSDTGQQELELITAAGTYTRLYFVPLRAIGFDSNSGLGVTVSNVSVKQVLGQHATQATQSNRPLLSARYNILDRNECDGDDGVNGWTLTGSGTTTEDRTDNLSGPWEGTFKGVTVTGNGSDWHRINTTNNKTVSASKQYRVSWVWKQGSSNNCRLQLRLGAAAVESYLKDFIAPNTYSLTENAGTLTDIETTELATDTYLTSATYTPNQDAGDCTFGIGTQSTTVGHTIIAYGVFCTELQYADLPYQRVGDVGATPSDYDSDPTKFPYYLKFDGTNDYMTVNGLSAAAGPLTGHFGYVTVDGETSGNQHLFVMNSGNSAQIGAVLANGVGYRNGGVDYAQSSDTEALSVYTLALQAGTNTVSRINGVLLGTTYANEYALTGDAAIGAWSNGSGGNLDGNLYSAILRTATSTDKEIDQAEAYIADRMPGQLIDNEWSLANLFEDGDVGFWYDPDDMGTTFGPELASGDYGAPSGYDANVDITSPTSIEVSGDTNPQTRAYLNFGAVAGKTYVVSYTIDYSTANLISYARNGINGGTTTIIQGASASSGYHTFTFTANNDGDSILWVQNVVGNFDLSGISVREVNPDVLGPELVTNGTFDSGVSGWTGDNLAVTYDNGKALGTVTTASASHMYQDITTEVGKLYLMSVSFTKGTATGNQEFRNPGSSIVLSSTGNYTGTFTATDTTSRLRLGYGVSGAGQTMYFDNISVKEVIPTIQSLMYQDSVGTTPVTGVEQPVGLMLDKSQGATLGSELFSSVTTVNSPWVDEGGEVYSIDGSQAGDTALYIESVLSNSVGVYRVSVTVSGYSAGNLIPRNSVNIADYIYANGKYEFTFYAGGNSNFNFIADANFIGTVSNISIKEVAGSHATQSITDSRPYLSARYNLLEHTEAFDDSYWSKVDSTLVANSETAPDGSLTADLLVRDDTNHRMTHTFGSADYQASKAYTYSLYMKNVDATSSHILLYNVGLGDSAGVSVSWSGSQLSSVNGYGPDLVSAGYEDVGSGWYRVHVKAVINATATSGGQVVVRAALSGQETKSCYLWGASLVESQYDYLPYQRVGDVSTTASDYDSDSLKFPKYLRFDGTDDYMVVNGLSSSSTPITAHFGYVTDDGESTPNLTLFDTLTGRLAMYGGTNGDIGYFDGAGVSTNIDTEALTVATFDMKSSDAVMRANGVSVNTDTGFVEVAIGGGEMLGARYDGTTNFLDGNLYQAVLVNKTYDDPVDINRAEHAINAKLKGGAY